MYSQIALSVPKEMAARFRELCAARGESQASVLKAAIKAYIERDASDPERLK